jgi:sulfate adenylyltransferase subunit 1
VLRLADDLGVARGALLADPADAPEPVTEFEATVAWLHEKPLVPGRRLLVKHGTRTTQTIVGAIGERLDPDTLTFGAAPDRLQVNDIAHVALRTADPLPVDDYAAVRATGSFLLIDPPTGNTLAAGLVGTPLAVAR